MENIVPPIFKEENQGQVIALMALARLLGRALARELVQPSASPPCRLPDIPDRLIIDPNSTGEKDEPQA